MQLLLSLSPLDFLKNWTVCDNLPNGDFSFLKQSLEFYWLPNELPWEISENHFLFCSFKHVATRPLAYIFRLMILLPFLTSAQCFNIWRTFSWFWLRISVLLKKNFSELRCVVCGVKQNIQFRLQNWNFVSSLLFDSLRPGIILIFAIPDLFLQWDGW